ncbi:MAG: class I SAM-dependent methyltransferase [Chloroflexi bacterium]|nr:class I SAM-dependent methyltransferase [Chloroflexota bacterium]
MHSTEFNAYKTRYRAAIRQVLAEAAPGRLDEAAFPAYSHPNPLINWLFWQRLRVVMDYIQQAAPVERVLDFGCGSGVMLPFLAEVSREVTALDVDLAPLEWVQRSIPLAANVRALDANQTSLADLASHSYDFINALDVLEHVDDLPRTLADLLRLLKPGGQIIISGPTENILYQLGRRLAGPEYSGAYHERGVAEIRADLAKLATVRPIATLYWPMPLFEIFAGQV